MSLEGILRKGKKFVIGSMIAANVLGLYNCNKNPANDIPPSGGDLDKTEVYTGETDEDGQAVFENGESVYVVDSDNESLEGINVGIVEGEDYSVISSYDSGGMYLPSLKFLNEIDEDTLHLLNLDESNVRTLSSEEDEICFKFLRDSMNNPSLSRSSDCYNYDETISGQDALYGYYAINVLLNGLGAGVAMDVADGVATLFDLIEEENLQEHVFNNNWDRYSFLNPAAEGLDIPNPPQIYFMTKSNKPVLTLEELVFDDGLHFRYSGSDQDYYEGQVNDLYIEDRTIPCRGSENNDLMLKYTISRLTGGEVLQDSTINDEVFLNIPSGNYRLKLELFDDTRLKEEYDDSGINISKLESFFDSTPDSNLKIIEVYDLSVLTNPINLQYDGESKIYIHSLIGEFYNFDIYDKSLGYVASFPDSIMIENELYYSDYTNPDLSDEEIIWIRGPPFKIEDDDYYIQTSRGILKFQLDDRGNLNYLEKIFDDLAYAPSHLLHMTVEGGLTNYQEGYLTRFESPSYNDWTFRIYSENFDILEEHIVSWAGFHHDYFGDGTNYAPIKIGSNGETIWGASSMMQGKGGLITINSNFEVVDYVRYANLLESSFGHSSDQIKGLVYASGALWSLHRKVDGKHPQSYYLCKHFLEN